MRILIKIPNSNPTLMILELIQAFILLIVIIDPPISMTAFHSLTKNMGKEQRMQAAFKAVLVAAIPLFLFIAAGNILLELLSVDMSTFKAAGGLILILLGAQLSLGFSLRNDDVKKETKTVGAIASIVGTPLITGPATISAAVILSNEMGMMIASLSALCALFVAYIALRLSGPILTRLGVTGSRILSNMLGLITIAWGMAFIKEGLLS
jgi:multiple antibiotic resistance protein